MKTTIELAQAADFHVSGDRIFSPYVGGQALNELLNTLVALVRAEREWVDLTDDEVNTLIQKWHKSDGGLFDYADEVIAAFKEKQSGGGL